MAVQVGGGNVEIDGYAATMGNFRKSHDGNSAALINLIHGRRADLPLPAYDPDHADHQFPLMIYSPNGEKVVGQSLKGLTGQARVAAAEQNEAELTAALKAGYRRAPYAKPQVAVLDPAVEKQALVDRNKELEGKIVALTDQHMSLKTMFENVMAKLGGASVSDDDGAKKTAKKGA